MYSLTNQCPTASGALPCCVPHVDEKKIYLRSHFGSRSILFDPTRIRSRIDWRNPPSGWITGSGRGPCLVPPLIFGGPWSLCLLLLRSPSSSTPFGVVDVGSGQENLLNTKLLNFGIPYLALYLIQLAGQAAFGLRSGSLGAPLPGGPIRIHFLLERCVGVSCDRPASSRTWSWEPSR